VFAKKQEDGFLAEDREERERENNAQERNSIPGILLV
jgi:hypothetical protein